MEAITILNIYKLSDEEIWNNVVKSFSNWDIYYLYEYAYSFMLHGDGAPLLIEYKDEKAHFCYVVMKSDIADCAAFTGQLNPGEYYDFETPYGYGGPLSKEKVPETSQKQFAKEITDYCVNNRIVSQFVRFHPVLANHTILPEVIETKYLRDTIYIDTESQDLIMSNMDSKNRNMVRKAIKNGVTIERRSIEDYDDFIKMYKETMLRDGAGEYYTFHEYYFKAQKALRDNACIFYAMLNEEPIAGSIMYYNEQFMHYHLSGSHAEFRKYAPSNLMLYEAACWASEKGIKKFHLGGGMTQEDSLFGFKKQFNRNGRLPYVVGRTIFDRKAYDKLMQLRKCIEISFDTDNSRMIQYRM